MSYASKRLNWIDQARGLAIFMVVYGHNFPSIEPYIYSVHVPLFFLISGIFQPAIVSSQQWIRRVKQLLIPYFFWATALFLFWWTVGRKFGKSSTQDLSVVDNFMGVFYAQGGPEYMDWGIPMWFLPCILLVFLMHSGITRFFKGKFQSILVLILGVVGFLWAKATHIHLPWSIDVAMVALIFYHLGFALKNSLKDHPYTHKWWLIALLFGVHITGFYFNPEKVDMYRSIYGSPLLFLISGSSGALAYILLFKKLGTLGFDKLFKPLIYMGQNTVVILATHLRALTLIKALLLVLLGWSVFEFTELQKFILAWVQIALLIPVIYLINRYATILNGKNASR